MQGLVVRILPRLWLTACNLRWFTALTFHTVV